MRSRGRERKEKKREMREKYGERKRGKQEKIN